MPYAKVARRGYDRRARASARETRPVIRLALPLDSGRRRAPVQPRHPLPNLPFFKTKLPLDTPRSRVAAVLLMIEKMGTVH